ncbi:MAG: dihydrofolate reductase [Muribaculaceae bacterium]|nr:dihydrofolate reductase [Muribaculaceae bacterium]
MTKPEVNIIVAVAPDLAIGRNGDLLFHISADLRRFKELTMGHPIIMGRKTFDSLPKGALPGRRNIVVSRNADYTASGAEVFGSLDDAIAACCHSDKVFIIGGAQIYGQAIDKADSLLLTRFDRTVDDADCHFPKIDDEKWQTVECSDWSCDEKSGVRYCFETLSRKK